MAHKHTLLKSFGSFVAAATLCMVVAPSQADARTGYAGAIPNGAALGNQVGGRECALCHVSAGGGGTRNSFGRDVQDNLGNNGPDWSGIYSLDSDGDGATNGEELCDPMGMFARGDTPPTCDFTDPNDPNDKPAVVEMDMGTPAEDMGTPAEDMGSPVEDMGTPAEDMGTPAADMGTPVVDMGTPAADMGTPAADMGGGQPVADMDSTSAADMGGAGGGDGGEDDEGCSQTGGGSPLGGGLTLLGMLGMLGFMRRRR